MNNLRAIAVVASLAGHIGMAAYAAYVPHVR